jgi:hypothetical protein
MIYVRQAISIVCQDGSAIVAHKNPDGEIVAAYMRQPSNAMSRSDTYIKSFTDMDAYCSFLDAVTNNLRINNTVLLADE